MKVIKVIVDEIPDSCNACDYEGNVECFRRMAFEEYINYDTTRPDWCPLVEECHCTKWMITIEQDGLTENISVKKAESEDESTPYYTKKWTIEELNKLNGSEEE